RAATRVRRGAAAGRRHVVPQWGALVSALLILALLFSVGALVAYDGLTREPPELRERRMGLVARTSARLRLFLRAAGLGASVRTPFGPSWSAWSGAYGWLTSMWRCGTSAIAWRTRSPTRYAQP